MQSVLLVDLNNFARYPTIPIGYLAKILRARGYAVRVFSPLSIGVKGVSREPRPHALSLTVQKLNYRMAVSTRAWLRHLRDSLAAPRRSEVAAHHDDVIRGFNESLAREKPSAVLISTYLMYRDLCVSICASAKRFNVPVLIGGPYFAQPEIIEEWIRIPGLTALAAGEVELRVPEILERMLAGCSPSEVRGVFALSTNGHIEGALAPPVTDLDAVPFPDFGDFPWDRYPNRIIPIATGRGCGWGVCTFCSDVTSTAGRTFRSRSAANVLAELKQHHDDYQARQFVYTDLKLNSNVTLWEALSAGFQKVVPGGSWIASVHVGQRRGRDNGLSASDLREVAASGCVRLTTGLETGSQRVADLMRKGTEVKRTGEFLAAASSAGISCRCTMILGYPGETAEDVAASARFLREHMEHIDRVALNRFAIMTGTNIHRTLQRKPKQYPGVTQLEPNHALASVGHHYAETSRPEYRRAAMKLLEAVHAINARELPQAAQQFEGVM